jgi:hypothetical protein
MLKRKREIEARTEGAPKARKSVSFATDVNLEVVHLVESFKSEEHREDGVEDTALSSSVRTSVRLTKEITVLSTLHGKSRRYLRDIDKIDLQAAVKYGRKERGNPDRKTGLPRWKYTFGNIVYITDHTSREEVTSYKESVSIQPAPISQAMIDRHLEVKQILQDEPQLCSSHTYVVLDQSGSMRTADVNGFRNRSQAAYGSLALDYVAERLYQQGDPPGADALTLIEMNDGGNIIHQREPIDWLLFNKLLERQKVAKPRSHGNYLSSLQLVKTLIEQELSLLATDDDERDDLPDFALIVLSDGKPSDEDETSVHLREVLVKDLAMRLNDKLSVFCMGLGASGADFEKLSSLADVAKLHGAQGDFNHAGLSAASLGQGFSFISSTMSSLRDAMLSTVDAVEGKDDPREIVKLKNRESLAKSRNDCRKFNQLNQVRRFRFDHKEWEQYNDPWKPMSLKNRNAIGFEIEKVPFGKGAERLAFRVQEVNAKGDLVGAVMVAKESKKIHNEGKKLLFHQAFCRTQLKAGELARLFDKAARKLPSLKPVHDYEHIPKIAFLKCQVYVFRDERGIEAGVLVENFLSGKFTKYNGNNGYVKSHRSGGRTIELSDGEVLLTDFLDAFSHWSYVHTDHNLLVCDLQGVLNEEGRAPTFQLTDPAICSRNKNRSRYGNTDLGMKGFRLFDHGHICNKVCKCLGLPRTASRIR